MADLKITDLTELTEALLVQGTDWVEVVDVSDTSMHASGTNKKMKVGNLKTKSLLHAWSDGKIIDTTTSPTSLFDSVPSFGAAVAGETLLVVAGGYVFNNSGGARGLSWQAKIGAATVLDWASGTYAASAVNKWPFRIVASFQLHTVHASTGVAHVQMAVEVCGSALGDSQVVAKSMVGANLVVGVDTTGPPTCDLLVVPAFNSADFDIVVQQASIFRGIPQ